MKLSFFKRAKIEKYKLISEISQIICDQREIITKIKRYKPGSILETLKE